MERITQKALRGITREMYAVDLTRAKPQLVDQIIQEEGKLETIAYSMGYYGVSGKLYRGRKSENFYTVIGYDSNLYRIG